MVPTVRLAEMLPNQLYGLASDPRRSPELSHRYRVAAWCVDPKLCVLRVENLLTHLDYRLDSGLLMITVEAPPPSLSWKPLAIDGDGLWEWTARRCPEIERTHRLVKAKPIDRQFRIARAAALLP